MATPIRVEPEDIRKLNDKQLVVLLKRLLHVEAVNARIPLGGIDVPLQINVSDGGEDGRIEWSDGPERTDYIPNRLTMFQSKATKMTKASCAKEVATKDKKIKPQIKEILLNKGSYIIFCREPLTKKQITPCITGIKEGLLKSGEIKKQHLRVDFYDGNKIADWVNQYFPTTVWVLEQVGRGSLAAFQTWKKWSGDPDVLKTIFVPDDNSLAIISQIQSHFITNSTVRPVARIVGMPGLGKTRTVFEAFRPPVVPDQIVQEALSDKVLYCKVGTSKDILLQKVRELVDNQAVAILLVDDCDEWLHKELSQIVGHIDSKLSLLTIDFDPKGTAGAENIIEIKQATDNVIKGIVEQSYPGMPAPDITRIVSFAQGFPRMAVLLGKANLDNISELLDRDLLTKMLWGRDKEDDHKHKIIQASALFKILGIDGRVKDQMKFVAEKICAVKPAEFYAVLQDFIERGVVQRRGDFIQVQPPPLALRLAAEKWKRIPPDDAKRFFIDEMPDGLSEALCDQLANLDFLKEARNIVEELCGAQGPFGQAEVLNTEKGSRCFRSLVEVAPDAAVSAIDRSFGEWSSEKLKDEVGPGRRNLIWSLEKLCFRKETFPVASRLLLSFAAGENESWSNNATGLFIQLFKLYLPGTEVPLESRLHIIDEALVDDDAKRQLLVVRALGSALQTHYFSRTGGAETQGSGPALKDYQPKTDEEIRTYYRNSLIRLAAIAREKKHLAEAARKEIAGHIRGLIGHGLIDMVIDTIETVIASHETYWPDALEALRHSMRFEGSGMKAPYKAKVQELYQKLLPKDLSTKLRFIVSEMPHDFYDEDVVEESGTTIKFMGPIKAEELAVESAKEPDILFKILPNLLKGEQRQAYAFGKKLGEIFLTPESFINLATEVLKNLPQDEANPTLLGAFLGGLESNNQVLVSDTLNKYYEDNQLATYLIDLTVFKKIVPSDLQRLLQAVHAGKLSLNQLRRLGYGSILNHIDPKDLTCFFNALIDIGMSGARIALGLIFMYSHSDKSRRTSLQAQISRIICMPEILSSDGYHGQLDIHQYKELAKWLLKTPPGSSSDAIRLTEEIIRLCKLDSYPYELNQALKELLSLMLVDYKDHVWPLVSSAVTSTNGVGRFNLEHLLGNRYEKKEEKIAPISLVPELDLLAWCKKHPQIAPVILMRIVPLLESDKNGNINWSSLIKKIISKYGDQKDVLEALLSNMLTFTWSGSMIPYYEQYIQPLTTLLEHKKKAVRQWARLKLKSFRALIERELKSEEERDFGIY